MPCFFFDLFAILFAVAGSLTLPFYKGPLAQLVEHRPFKAMVVGSNPTRLTSVPIV